MKRIVTVWKASFQKSKPKEILYRNHKYFDISTFKNVLRLKLESFEQVFLEVLNKQERKEKVSSSKSCTIPDKVITQRHYLKNRTIKNKAKYKRQNNFCSKRYKKEWKKFCSNLELNQITDNKRVSKTIKPLLSDKCIQSSVLTLINNENVISDNFKLAQTFNNCFKSVVKKLGIKECEASPGVNANSRSKDGVEVAIEKYKDHPSIKMIN